MRPETIVFGFDFDIDFDGTGIDGDMKRTTIPGVVTQVISNTFIIFDEAETLHWSSRMTFFFIETASKVAHSIENRCTILFSIRENNSTYIHSFWLQFSHNQIKECVRLYWQTKWGNDRKEKKKKIHCDISN